MCAWTARENSGRGSLRRRSAKGFGSANALPLQLRSQVIGSLNLFHTWKGGLASEQLRLAQALADAATIGILQQRTMRHGEVIAGRLQDALTSRVVIEQAEGVLGERLPISTDDAFGVLRATARSRNRLLFELARKVADGSAGVGGAAHLGPSAGGFSGPG
jgi:hypothetical protein